MALIDDIVAYWKLDESSGNPADSVASYDLTNVGTAGYSSGKINNGIDLGANNTTKYIHRADNFGLTYASERSIAFWFNPVTQPGANQTLMRLLFGTNPGNYTDISYGDDGGTKKIIINTSPETFIVDQTLTNGTWYHFIITHDGGGTTDAIKLYLNNSLILEGDSWDSSDFTSLTTRLTFGTDQSFNGKASGSFDECVLFNKILSSDERAQLYNSGAGNQYPFSPVSTFKPKIMMY